MKSSFLRLVLVVALLLLNLPLQAPAQNWMLTSAPITNWVSIASSADGSKLVAAAGLVNPGPIYTSMDSGATWHVTTAPYNQWTCVASSADGSRLLAGASPPGGVWVSTDSGASWAPTIYPSSEYFVSAGSSADGDKLLAVASSIYTSTNGGVAWVWNPIDAFVAQWTASAASASGTTLLVLGYMHGNIDTMLISTNWGLTWTNTSLDQTWSSAAASADGSKLAAVSTGKIVLESGIFASANYGRTWTATDVPMLDWTSIASSADGNKLVAAAVLGSQPGPIYASTNFGATWLPSGAATNYWKSVASSADGCKLVAAVAGGGIYTLQTTPNPVLHITPVGNFLLLSWIIPSRPFILEQSFDLNAGWVAIQPSPSLNYTNLQYQLKVPKLSGGAFYRLLWR